MKPRDDHVPRTDDKRGVKSPTSLPNRAVLAPASQRPRLPVPFFKRARRVLKKKTKSGGARLAVRASGKDTGTPEPNGAKTKPPVTAMCPFAPFPTKEFRVAVYCVKKKKGAVVSRATQLRKSPVKNRCTRWGNPSRPQGASTVVCWV